LRSENVLGPVSFIPLNEGYLPMSLQKIIVFVSAFSITAVLAYLSVFPSYVLQVSVEPRSSKGLEMRRDRTVVISNGKEPIFLDIGGDVSNPNISKVSLSVRDPNNVQFEKRGEFKVSKGSFLGTVQLGSREDPVADDEDYPYVIDSADDNSRLSEGSMQVRVKAVISYLNRGSMVLMAVIGGIGLLASALQIYQFFAKSE
jgi:hypothetical protein